jgi:predicted nicotinamide N-methyase
MADNRETAFPARVRGTIAGYDAHATEVVVGEDTLRVWQVVDLERYVDRAALLGAVDPPDPPYWAHCWSGARALAERVHVDAGRVLEVGCGLGLPGLVAARRGADVVFADRVDAPLRFVAASLAANGLSARGLVAADMLRPPWRAGFDVVLAAEVLYDRATFPALAQALAGAIRPRGVVLLADGHRIDTAAFYEEARRVGFEWARDDVRRDDDGVPETVSLVTLRLDGPGRTS